MDEQNTTANTEGLPVGAKIEIDFGKTIIGVDGRAYVIYYGKLYTVHTNDFGDAFILV